VPRRKYCLEAQVRTHEDAGEVEMLPNAAVEMLPNAGSLVALGVAPDFTAIVLATAVQASSPLDVWSRLIRLLC
jgi:hypothetical protein